MSLSMSENRILAAVCSNNRLIVNTDRLDAVVAMLMDLVPIV